MRVLLVGGARPNFMKVAPVWRAVVEVGAEAVLVHTGQHYDFQMSEAFFRDLGLPDPDHYLNAGSASHAVQTARVLEAFEPVLLETKPDWVVVVGDVNSTLACALVAAKLKQEVGCAIAHVEAGLRSRDWRMPEEVNRVLTDRLSDLLLVPSRDAIGNLLGEGIEADRIAFAGNVMVDTLLHELPAALELGTRERLGLHEGGYAVTTLHRPSNVDEESALRPILSGLAAVADRMPVVFPVHPRTKKQAQRFGLGRLLEPLTIVDPLGYREMLSLTAGAAVVLTDSGGLQEETTVLGVPCVTLREQTERPITIEQGTNRLAPWPLSVEGIVEAVGESLARGRVGVGTLTPEGWDGRAAERITEELRSRTGKGSAVMAAVG
jgi:UDP-N-acetylglucosamine 2-epimerase (non-hydrolysing)